MIKNIYLKRANNFTTASLLSGGTERQSGSGYNERARISASKTSSGYYSYWSIDCFRIQLLGKYEPDTSLEIEVSIPYKYNNIIGLAFIPIEQQTGKLMSDLQEIPMGGIVSTDGGGTGWSDGLLDDFTYVREIYGANGEDEIESETRNGQRLGFSPFSNNNDNDINRTTIWMKLSEHTVTRTKDNVSETFNSMADIRNQGSKDSGIQVDISDINKFNFREMAVCVYLHPDYQSPNNLNNTSYPEWSKSPFRVPLTVRARKVSPFMNNGTSVTSDTIKSAWKLSNMSDEKIEIFVDPNGITDTAYYKKAIDTVTMSSIDK